MDELPEHINCKSKVIAHCDFYMHKSCPETCGYALDVKGLGVGAMMIMPQNVEGLTEVINKELKINSDNSTNRK